MSSSFTPSLDNLASRTIAMPRDTNPSGDIFGGWLLSQMDLAGGFLAAIKAKGRITTVAIKEMTFHKPVHVGDEVSCYGEITRVGNTSLTVYIEAWVHRLKSDEKIKVTEGEFIYVAIDDEGKPVPVSR
ncbi:MAG: acyl-CoA thioesterase [Alphaproteobacteria bacterium]|jgi:acyl-CoA thioesterase YciA|nr:acyl-CoA thioesterase [Alphaproteobacteria bacterium]MBT5390407.1 acyl-CoA thioesterase [Alphaproteobacteria bacterium]MBT5540621.1 acyl-CoA thioesterase [Alphaproteobacteria bacterium]